MVFGAGSSTGGAAIYGVRRRETGCGAGGYGVGRLIVEAAIRGAGREVPHRWGPRYGALRGAAPLRGCGATPIRGAPVNAGCGAGSSTGGVATRVRLGRFDRWVRDMGCGAEGPPVGIAVIWGAAQDGAGGYMVAGRDTGCGAGGSGGRDTGVPWAARGAGVLQVGVKNAVSLLGRFASWMTLFLEGHRPHADVLPSRSLPRSFLQPRSA